MSAKTISVGCNHRLGIYTSSITLDAAKSFTWYIDSGSPASFVYGFQHHNENVTMAFLDPNDTKPYENFKNQNLTFADGSFAVGNVVETTAWMNGNLLGNWSLLLANRVNDEATGALYEVDGLLGLGLDQTYPSNWPGKWGFLSILRQWQITKGYKPILSINYNSSQIRYTYATIPTTPAWTNLVKSTYNDWFVQMVGLTIEGVDLKPRSFPVLSPTISEADGRFY
jgi:hypothetical protein